MLCQNCKLEPATVHVIHPAQHFEVCPDSGTEVYKFEPTDHYLCQGCAQSQALTKPSLSNNIAGMLKAVEAAAASAPKARQKVTACPDCGMTLREFRALQRLGCPKDYEVFGKALAEVLERIHGATAHSGRLPGMNDPTHQRERRIQELQSALDAAVRDEAYEAAARLRDELRAIQ
ncbi:MAG: hypothetical protein FJ294_06380 [Planctomycetes bacterium]|nr:hypothetical protein [Planctomycetota bacterium]